MQTRCACILVMGIALGGVPSEVSAEPLIEISLSDGPRVGKSVAHDKQACWLMQSDGSLELIPLRFVKSFRRIGPQFRADSAATLKTEFWKEFGRGFDVVGTSHYVVCAPPDRSRRYADLFESVYRSLHIHFSTRGIAFREPEFPLTAVVFPSEKEFAENCRKDGVPAVRGLLGYYLLTSNRVALFDDGSAQAAIPSDAPPQGWPDLPDETKVSSLANWSFNRAAARAGTISGSLGDTIVHEATHQVAYNCGIHSRISPSPRWVVEGLATALEPASLRIPSAGLSRASRANAERLEWFRQVVATGKRDYSLAESVADDRMFQTRTLDAYAEAWALTFFLMETRSSEYARYLKMLATRSPFLDYTAEERLADFQTAFGNDLNMLDVEMRRFVAAVR